MKIEISRRIDQQLERCCLVAVLLIETQTLVINGFDGVTFSILKILIYLFVLANMENLLCS